jgi:hypothetical protein
MDEILTPDRHGFVRVFVGGKYGQWRRLADGGLDDAVVLDPVGEPLPTRVEHPDQLSLADDPAYETMRLGQSSPTEIQK